MEVITREFPQIGGYRGLVPGSFGFLMRLRDEILVHLKSLGAYSQPEQGLGFGEELTTFFYVYLGFPVLWRCFKVRGWALYPCPPLVGGRVKCKGQVCL